MFGMGYLLRCSMKTEGDIKEIQDSIQEFVPEASFISSAGTEFAMRLPKEAVRIFPSLFEYIDTHKQDLSVVNYGIETTTLEEVFMRIVNEDTETLVENHREANRLLGASGAERDVASIRQKQQDEKRYPLSEATVSLLLEPGRPVGSTESSIITKQIAVLFKKRFHQFTRSKGQWSMGVVVPAIMIAISAVIMQAIPDKLIYGNPSSTDTNYTPYPYTTPVAGENQSTAETWAGLAGVDDIYYVGTNYTSLYSFLENQTATSLGNLSSGSAVYYSAFNNATVLYNTTHPLWYPGLISGILQNALTEVTGGRLVVTTTSTALPQQALDTQVSLNRLLYSPVALGELGYLLPLSCLSHRRKPWRWNQHCD